jgi:glycosyltransferase involved in cell wall biosynthesis
MRSIPTNHSLTKTPVLSFVIPCLNEASTIGSVIDDCIKGGNSCNQPYEIIVADNGSTDGSRDIAVAKGATVIPVKNRGYGSALIAGIRSASGDYVIMGDADSTYEFQRADEFLAKLQQGYDMVMGNRFLGNIAPGAMPILHHYLGNPVISALGRLFFGLNIGDFYCGLRGFDRNEILGLNLNCPGMEFALEMVIKSGLLDLRTTEIPTNLRPNPPGRKPHLNTWRDGWRSIKFMLSFSPKYSFLPLAIILLSLAIILMIAYARQAAIFTSTNTLVFATSCLLAAVGIVSDYLLTREMLYAKYSSSRSRRSDNLDRFLGLRKGTDRLFKFAAAAFLGSIVGFACLTAFAARGLLHLPAAGIVSLLSCTLMLGAVSTYLTATKINSYRSLHTP